MPTHVKPSSSFRNEFTPRGPFFSHDVRAKEQARLVGVVRAAAQLDIRRNRLSTIGERHDVVILEESRFATAPRGTHERAAAAITAPDFTLHR